LDKKTKNYPNKFGKTKKVTTFAAAFTARHIESLTKGNPKKNRKINRKKFGS
jgi:hypothetical protein